MSLLTLERSMDSGRPPQGTKVSVRPVSRRWKVLRKGLSMGVCLRLGWVFGAEMCFAWVFEAVWWSG